MPGCSWRGHLRGVHIHYCPGVLGGDTCEGYIFITARVFLEGTPAMGTYGFHYCPGVLGGDTYDGYIGHRFHELRSKFGKITIMDLYYIQMIKSRCIAFKLFIVMQLWDKCYINFKKINEITFQMTHLEVVLLHLVLLYYEVTLPDIFPLRYIFGGVTNLAYYMAKRMEWVTKQKRLILPYGMLLTRLFKLIMNENHDLYNESYVLYDRVMNPLAAQQERKTRKDRGTRRGRHSTSSSFAFNQPSSSHLNDDDDGNGERTSRASTPSLIRYVNSLTNQVPQVFQNPPNIDPHLEPFYTRQTEIINRQVQIRDKQRGGLRSSGKGLKNLWINIKK
ncbi:hypothetical protein Tco_0512313 [Tanacetum coccineum]